MEIPDWRLTAAAQLWGSATTALQEQLSEATWNTWFRDVRAADLDGERLRLTTPNAVVVRADPLELQQPITAVVHQVAGDEVVIDLTVEAGPRLDEPVLVEPSGRGRRHHRRRARPAPAAPPPAPDPASAGWTALNPRYTFDHFVIGASNRFAHAAALVGGRDPGAVVQPALHLRPGRTGQDPPARTRSATTCRDVHQAQPGPVRLDRDAHERVRRRDPRTTPRTPSGAATARSTSCSSTTSSSSSARQQLQEEFFHTFNSLHGAGGQIVLSSDRPPKQIPRLEDRLRTRLEWGLITDVQPPEFETRLAILRMKAESERLDEPPRRGPRASSPSTSATTSASSRAR